MTVPENPAMEAHVGTCKGETIVVIGNGPSLLSQDLSWLPGMTTMAVNRAYLLPRYNHTLPESWHPTYAAWTDHRKVNFKPPVYDRCVATFVNRADVDGAHENARDWPNLVPWDAMHGWQTPCGRARMLERSKYEGIVMAGTTSISAVHLAFMLGARSVWMVGCDHSYDREGRSHFYSPPDVRGMHDIRAQIAGWAQMQESWALLTRAWPGDVLDAGVGKPGMPKGYKRARAA